MAHRHAKLYRQNGSRFISIDLGTVDGKRFRRVARSPEYDGGENWFEAGRRTTSMREATGWTADYIELAEAMENGTPTASKLTRALVAEYMAERSKKSPSTVAKARQITTEILADFEGRAVRSISIHTTLDRLARTPSKVGRNRGSLRSDKTISDLFAHASSFVKWLNAEPRSYGLPTPTRPTYLETSGPTKKTGRTPEEIERLLPECDARGIGDLVRLLVGTGVRIGEACALRWEDVKTVGGFQAIEVSESYDRNRRETRTTKGKRARLTRVGRLAQPLLADAGRRSGLIVDRKTLAGTDALLREALEAADLRVEGELWHQFRHTFAYNEIHAGATIEQLAMWLGHANPNTTRRHYPGVDLNDAFILAEEARSARRSGRARLTLVA